MATAMGHRFFEARVTTQSRTVSTEVRSLVAARYPEWVRIAGASVWDALEAAVPHPLRTLLLRDDGCRGVSIRTHDALRRIDAANGSWLSDKRRELFSNDRRNNAAVLGEIRAYDAMLQAWGDRVVPQREIPGSPRADFLVSGGTRAKPFTVSVEVTTVLSSTKNTRHDSPAGPIGGGAGPGTVQVTVQESSVAPLRFADKPGENVASQAVWQLMQRKEDELQLGTAAASILWLDLADPDTWPLGFGVEQSAPFSSFNAAITSGALWWSLYGKKGDPLFNATSLEGIAAEAASQAFDGRFVRNSKADFVLADFGQEQVLFENPGARSRVPARLYPQLLQLPRLALECSWLNWPGRRSLGARTEEVRRAAHAFVRALRIRHHPL